MLQSTRNPTLRVIAPSNSLATLPGPVRAVGVARLEALGFRVEFGEHAEDLLLHRTGAVSRRLEDLEAALDDPHVDVVMAAQGGSNSNQLLPHIDYSRPRPAGKRFVGFSDITALLLALGARTAVTVVHGPTFTELCDPLLPDYTVKGLLACLQGRSVRYVSPAATSRDVWSHYDSDEPRSFVPFDGWKVLHGGRASGLLVGGNLATVAALAGTPYFPETRGRILFLEDAVGDGAGAIHRELSHLAQLGAFEGLAGFIFGMVPLGAALGRPGMLRAILADVLPARASFPVVTGFTCSHMAPMASFPLFRPAELALDGHPRLIVGQDRPGDPVHVEGSDALRQSL